MRGQIYSVGVAVTKSDTVDIAHPRGRDGTDALYVGGAGTCTVMWLNGTESAFTVVAGQILPIKIKRVMSTGTASTLWVALYNL